MRVVGPCVQDPQDIKCSFGQETVDGRYLKDERQFLCVTPEFENREVGRVSFTLSFTHDGDTVTLKSRFYKSELCFYQQDYLCEDTYHQNVHSVVVHEHKVTIISNTVPIPFKDKVIVTWDPEFLPVKDPQDYKVDIDLYELSTIDESLKKIATVLTDAPNNGSTVVIVPTYPTTRGTILNFFKVTLAQSHTRGKRQSDAIKLLAALVKGAGWGSAIVAAGNAFINLMCAGWSRTEPDGETLLDQVEPCPWTESQARLPSSNFEVEVFNCFGVEIQGAHKLFHSGADICFRQKTLRYIVIIIIMLKRLPFHIQYM